MPEIEFTQYKLPHGRAVPVRIDRPDPVYEKARRLMEAGYVFECEVLTDGEVSLTITDDEADHAIEVCPNGPEVPAAVDKLILGFAAP